MRDTSDATRCPGNRQSGRSTAARTSGSARATLLALLCLILGVLPCAAWADDHLDAEASEAAPAPAPAPAPALEETSAPESSTEPQASKEEKAEQEVAAQDESAENTPANQDEHGAQDEADAGEVDPELAAHEALARAGDDSAGADDPEIVIPEEDFGESIMFQEIPSVYGVSKFEQKITEAPSFVTLITSEEITRYGYRTMAEVLQSVTGFFVSYDRNYHYLGIRGFNRPGDFNSRVLVLVDGHRLNDSLYDQGGLGTEGVIDVDLIDRVEVIRGPGSSLYGTNAFFGVINVITKRGRDIRGTEVSGEVGSLDTYRGRGTYGNKFSNGVELLFSGSYYSSQGQEALFYDDFDDPRTGNGVVRGADDDSFPSFFGKVSWRDLTAQGGFVSREKGIPTGKYGTYFPTDETRSTDEHAYFFLKYERDFENLFNLTSRIYYDRFYYQGDYLYDFNEDPDPVDLVLNRDKSIGEWWGLEAKFDRRILDSHNVTAGIEYRDNFRQDLWNADLDPFFQVLDDKRDSWNVAVFVQDEFTILENLKLNAGVRYDHYDTFGDTFNPRVALVYNMPNTTVKALFGTAFRGPNAYERFYVGTGFKSNENLDPEKIQTYELVLEHSLTEYIRGTMTGYFYRIDDLISQTLDTDDDLLFFENREKVEAMGLEMQLEMDDRGPLGVGGRLGYALQEARDRRTNSRLTNSPAHLVNLNLSVPLFQDKLYGGLETLYASERKTLAGDVADDRVLSNLTLTLQNLLRGVEISASVRNLLNQDYADPGSGEQEQDVIEQDGRTFWLKVKYGF